MDRVLLLGLVGIGYYAYTNPEKFQEATQQLQEQFQEVLGEAEPEGEPTCPEGFLLSKDKSECLDTKNPCGEGFILKPDGETCTFEKDPCGECYKYNDDTSDCDPIPNCNTVTGSEIGDVFLYMGESIVLGVIFDALGRRVGTVIERKAQQLAEKEAQKKAADATAKKLRDAAAAKAAKEAEALAVRKLAQEAAQKAIQTQAQKEVQEKLAKRTTGIIQKQAEKNLAIIATKRLAARLATMTVKIAALSSTVVGIVLTPLAVISTGLTVGLIASGTRFDKESPNDHEWDDLPEGARVAVEAVPVAGDIISILAPFIAFKDGCASGLEEQNSLCYEPAKPGFKCESFLCYANAAAYPFSGLSESLAHIAKKILTDTGTIPNTCPAGLSHGIESTDAAPGFCYDKPSWADKIVAGVAWEGGCPAGFTDTGSRCEDLYGNGVGELKVCPAGWNTTPLTCEEPIQKHITPCPYGSWDLAGTCWTKSCSHSWGCFQDDITKGCCNTCKSTCADVVSVGLAQRNFSLSGGAIKGRAAGSDLPCPAGTSEGYNGLCFPNCREGYRREGNLCTRSYDKKSQVLTPHGNTCGDGKINIDGLCYSANLPTGYRRKTLGLLDQDCPLDKEEWKGYENFKGTLDIGVSCQKATYTRKPFPKISIYGKKRVEPPPDPPPEPLPELCSKLKDGDGLCRLSDTPEGFDITLDGLNFFKKCKEGYTFMMGANECQKYLDDGKTEAYSNAEGMIPVQYSRR